MGFATGLGFGAGLICGVFLPFIIAGVGFKAYRWLHKRVVG